MVDENISNPRRHFLRAVGLVPAAALLSGGASLVPSAAQAQDATPASTYTPTYFDADEWAFIHAAVDRLIPSNEDGPGGLDLNVPEFIDKQMETSYGHGGFWYMSGPFVPDSDYTLGYQLRYTPREMYRVAIADINAACQKANGKNFADLDAASQDEVLGQLQKGTFGIQKVLAIEFFIQLLANTKEGYFADPMYGGNLNMGSWKMIGFPGARADYKDWIAQYDKVYPLGPVSILGEKA
jgi:gluconate 2-dehydrogenase gamma chain